MIGRDRKANSLVTSILGGYGCRDTDDLTIEVDERASRASGIDRRIGLEHPRSVVRAEGTFFGAVDPRAYGLLQFKRTPDGEDPITDRNFL